MYFCLMLFQSHQIPHHSHTILIAIGGQVFNLAIRLAKDRLCFMARPLRIEFDRVLYNVTQENLYLITDTNRVLFRYRQQD
jgi:hypothetical protein